MIFYTYRIITWIIKTFDVHLYSTRKTEGAKRRMKYTILCQDIQPSVKSIGKYQKIPI